MRKVTVKLEMRIVMFVNEGVEISNVVNELVLQRNIVIPHAVHKISID